ncbi:MAG: hypothetical protein IT449_01210 [Phycisphaerales bacterium]|nr:hypothetical protein [Phycisphaerales bacterium]
MNREDEQLIDLFLDGRLDAQQREQMRRRIEQDDALRAELLLQERLDGAVRRVFAPPAEHPSQWTGGQAGAAGRSSATAHAVLAGEAGATGLGASFPRRARWVLRPAALLAACLLLGLSVGVYYLGPRLFTRGGHAEARLPQSFAEVREELIAGGFEPDWRCEIGPKFAMYVYHRLGQTLLPASIPPRFEIMGWAYRNCLSPETMVLLTRIEDEPVLVFIDRKDSDQPQAIPAGSGLFIHKTELNELVLYELSENPQPRMLGLFFEPPLQEGWLDISIYGD